MELIGSLEEMVLIILLKNDKMSTVDIAKQYHGIVQKMISVPALHVVLKRMEKKGWVKSTFGEPTAARGGRRKRIYWATPTAYQVVMELNHKKAQLVKGIAKPSLQYVPT